MSGGQQTALPTGADGRPARYHLLGPWPAHWPLSVLLAGFPIWWILGLSDVLPILLALPMVVQLARRDRVLLPGGINWWALFLVWVGASGLMLFVDAPGAVPGGGGGRVLVWAYRFGWYLAVTVVMLWVANLSERELPTRLVVRLFGWMFVVTAAGGLLGVLAPTLELRSLLEVLLPRGLTSNAFVASRVEPRVAVIQRVLGEEGARPLAPFPYANTWGSSLSMFLPFFLVGWLGRDGKWRRWTFPLLAIAAVPAIASLNRGLWASLALGAVFLLVRWLFRGRLLVFLSATLVIALAVVTLLMSPLGDIADSRLDNPHSNDRRGQLLGQTVTSTAEASPILGFGSTRDVQGSFASIAGGGTPDCPACRVPPLGTQGQIWLVIFAQGFVGLVSFTAFFLVRAAGHWRVRTPIEAIGMVLLLFLAIQVFIYDTLGMPLLTVMAGIGLMWREQWRHGAYSSVDTLAGRLRRLRQAAAPILVLVALGAVAGGTWGVTRPSEYGARVAIELAPTPIHLAGVDVEGAREITIDTEAGMVLSEQAVAPVAERLGAGSSGALRASTRVTAAPLTRVLYIEVRAPSRSEAVERADALAFSYLAVRNAYLEQRRAQLTRELTDELMMVQGSGILADGLDVVAARPTAEEAEESDSSDSSFAPETATGQGSEPVLAETALRSAIDDLEFTPVTAGEIIRSATPSRVRRQIEVPIVSGALVGLLAGLGWMSLRHRGSSGPRRVSAGRWVGR